MWCVQHNINYFNKSATGNGTASAMLVQIPTLAEDSTWGPQTEAAVRAFQTDVTSLGLAKLQTDGIVGPQTGEAIMRNGDGYYTGYGYDNNAYCYNYLASPW